MTFAAISAMIDGVKVPAAYHHFPDNSGQQPPFICFYYDRSDDLYADNTNYQKIETLVIELYTDYKDFALEADVEAALKKAGLTYSRDETYIDSESMHETIYTTVVLINE